MTSSFLPLRRHRKINFALLLPGSSPAESWCASAYHSSFWGGEGPGPDPEFNLEGEYRREYDYTPMRRYLHIRRIWWMYTCAVGEPPDGWKKISLILPWSIYLLLLFIILFMVTFGTYFFTPYHLDVPCYLNNRQRYCSVWSERLGLFTNMSSIGLNWWKLAQFGHNLTRCMWNRGFYTMLSIHVLRNQFRCF